MKLNIDLCGGAGGWDCGADRLGMDLVGIELDADACATRAAAGLFTIRADITNFPLERLVGRVEGLCASPPCTDFSAAGLRKGLVGETGPLVWEPLRWAFALRPQWLAWEQVKEVMPVWKVCAATLRTIGYSVWTGVLDAVNYGTPQNRKRAILLARLGQPVHPPEPTHSRSGASELFGPALPRWVSMADALGWQIDGRRVETQNGSKVESGNTFDPYTRPSRTICGARTPRFLYTGSQTELGGERRERYERDLDRPAPTVDTKAGRDNWKLDTRRDVDAGGSQTRELDQPAPAVTGGRSQWVLRHPGRAYTAEPAVRPIDEPAPTVALGHNQVGWVWERPATTVMGDTRIWPPGHHGGGTPRGEPSRNAGAITVTHEELAILQDFRADWPFRGNKTSVARQIGNAIPASLAAACLAAVIDRNT